MVLSVCWDPEGFVARHWFEFDGPSPVINEIASNTSTHALRSGAFSTASSPINLRASNGYS